MTMRRPGDVHVALGPGLAPARAVRGPGCPPVLITFVNDLSAQVVAEVGVDISERTPTLIDQQLVRDVDVVVTLGREAHVDPVPGTQFENWDTAAARTASRARAPRGTWRALTGQGIKVGFTRGPVESMAQQQLHEQKLTHASIIVGRIATTVSDREVTNRLAKGRPVCAQPSCWDQVPPHRPVKTATTRFLSR